MESADIAMTIVALLILSYSLLARALGHWNLTAPIAFVAAGYLMSSWVDFDQGIDRWLLPVAELTLALVLFHDAASVRPRQIDREGSFVARLLLIGLPLSIFAGFGLAMVLFPGIPWAAALLLGALLSPTDAALGAATVSDKRVPVRIRRVLNVESGLNDGLATPVVFFAIAALLQEEDLDPRGSTIEAVAEIAIAIAIGAIIGFISGQLMRITRARGWSSPTSLLVATLAVPFAAFYGSPLLGGNGFIATFVAGSFFGIALKQGVSQQVLLLPEGLSIPLGDVTWLAFGLLMLPLLLTDIGATEILFAIASLTLLRMGPVWLSLLGSDLRLPSVLFIGWFGPRGLASVVFSLIAPERLARDGNLNTVLATASLTILLSVVLHGVSAVPGATRYSNWVNRVRPETELGECHEPMTRGRVSPHHHKGEVADPHAQ